MVRISLAWTAFQKVIRKKDKVNYQEKWVLQVYLLQGTFAKGIEAIIKPRSTTVAKEKRLLSKNVFGLKKKSGLSAIDKVLKSAKKVRA